MADFVLLEAAEDREILEDRREKGQLDAIVERAAVTWLELKERRVGQGSKAIIVFCLYILKEYNI